MRTLKLTLAYDGADFSGWQRQPKRRTVQGTLEQALAQITGREVAVAGSGRTDAGVHAVGQVASFDTEATLEPDVFRRALNAELPDDLLVLSAEEARPGFHARFDAIGKCYRYLLHDGDVPDLFARRYHWHVPRPLDADAMHEAAQALLGTHDFRSFETAWPNRETSVRTITEIRVVRGAGGDGGLFPLASGAATVCLEVAADGFLYNMVRAIAGTLYEVGRGAQPVAWPAEALSALDRSAAGRTAPAQGLFLWRVDYPPHAAETDTRPTT